MLEQIETFFKRLKVYTEVPTTGAMMRNVIAKIMAKVLILGILAIASLPQRK